MNITGMLARVPRVWLFAAAGLLQVALIALMVADRVQILRSGTEVMLQTRPVDPRDFLRGDYVSLTYDISTVPVAGPKDQWTAKRGTTVFVRLTPDADGYYRAVSLQPEPTPPVVSPDILIRGRVVGRGGQIKYGIERYFVPQGEGREIEQALRRRGKVAIVAAVAPDGRAAIKRLLMDGEPVYNEPLF